MISHPNWSKLFNKSSFFALNKEEDLNCDLTQIQYDKAVDRFHPNRKNEFLLGRLCASQAHFALTGKELNTLPSNKDRSPAWPQEIVGSISHNQFWVGSAVAEKKDLLGVGIDFEVMGRTKLELSAHIKNNEDLKAHPDLTEEELLTLIFSCKESLYKALYPTVQKFFGFEAAAVKEIHLGNQTFVIELITQLNFNFGPTSRHLFYGRLARDEKSCLTALEIPHT